MARKILRVARTMQFPRRAPSPEGVAQTAPYGPNYRRLQEVKAAYDSGNFFRMNQNIQPLGVEALK